MMETIKMRDKKWFDEDDFTPEHDAMMFELMRDWREYINSLQLSYNDEPLFIGDGELEGEPSLHGKFGGTVVYPDAIADLGVYLYHPGYLRRMCYIRDKMVEAIEDERYRCSKCHVITYKDKKCWINQRYNFIFEIKPQVHSFGSVLRQLKIYEERGSYNTVWVKPVVILVTNDRRYDEFFKDQHIYVVHPGDISRGE
jgi:hypothetical protein